MVRNFLEVSVETFVNATEDEDKVIEAVKNVTGMDFPPGFSVNYAEGTHGNPIGIIYLSYRRSREVRYLINRFREKPYWKTVLKEAERRMDESQTVHFRLDKQAAYEGEERLWASGEAIKIKVKIVTYPSSRDQALRILRETAQKSI